MTSPDIESGLDIRSPSATRHAASERADAAAGTRGSPGWPILAAIGFVAFAILTVMVGSGTVIPFDQPLLAAAGTLGAYMPAWGLISDSANYPLIAIGVAIVAWLLLTRRWAEAVLVIVVLALATAGSELVKQAIARPRPPGFDTSVIGVVYSYPSGHVLEALTIYGMIAVFLWRSHAPRLLKIGLPVVFVVTVALVAIARVAVGAHYPSDVLGGILAGIGCLAAFVWALDRIERHRRRSSDPGRDGHVA